MHESFKLTSNQLQLLQETFHVAAESASVALENWLSVPALIHVEAVTQCPLSQALQTLGDSSQPIGTCFMNLQGSLQGPMLLAFDDSSGLALADYLLGHPAGTSRTWGEVEISAATESMNIIGSAYISRVAEHLSEKHGQEFNLMPSPPEFSRDYAGALLQSAFMAQITDDSPVIFSQASFELSGKPVKWTFLFIPEPDSFNYLAQILRDIHGPQGSPT